MTYKDDHDFTSFPESLQRYQEIKDWVEAKHRKGRLNDFISDNVEKSYKENLYLGLLSSILKATSTRSLEMADYLLKQEVALNELREDIEDLMAAINLLEEQNNFLEQRVKKLEEVGENVLD